MLENFIELSAYSDKYVIQKLVNSPTCPRCGEGAETMDHLFRECSISVTVWKALSTVKFLQKIDLDVEQWYQGPRYSASLSLQTVLPCVMGHLG